MTPEGPVQFPYDYSLDQVIVERRSATSNPNIGEVFSSKLKEGPRSGKSVVNWEIVDSDGEHHHYHMKLESFSRTQEHGWRLQDQRSFSLDETGQLASLYAFLGSVLNERLPENEGDYLIVVGDERIEEISAFLSDVDAPEKLEVVGNVLRGVIDEGVSIEDLAEALNETGGQVLGELGSAARFLEYSRACERLAELIESTGTLEAELQDLLAANPWMFGSEYSELLPRRAWTRDDMQDFMLRRTVDGYLELIEIKRPFEDDLFRHDSSHDSWYPAASLSRAMGQAARYIEQIDRRRDAIVASDEEDVVKIRARIIIGRDGSPAQQEALKTLNGHLHRIEVLTFDQLRRIANRVLSVFGTGEDRASRHNGEPDDDIPF